MPSVACRILTEGHLRQVWLIITDSSECPYEPRTSTVWKEGIGHDRLGSVAGKFRLPGIRFNSELITRTKNRADYSVHRHEDPLLGFAGVPVVSRSSEPTHGHPEHASDS